MQALLQSWLPPHDEGRRHWEGAHQTTLAPWPQPLPAYIDACLAQGLDAALVRHMLAACMAALAPWDAAEHGCSPAARQSHRPQRIAQFVDLANALQRLPGAESLLQNLVSHVRAQPLLYPLLVLAGLAQALRPQWAALPPAQQLRAEVLAALHAALAEPPLPADDHRYLGVQWACRCADCTRAINWALSPTATPLTLAMAEARRRHVEESLKRSTAQFGFETLKKGSPHQLVLRKIDNLPLQRRQLREQWAGDLAALG